MNYLPTLGMGGFSSQFVPTQIAGCKLWLRADLGVTGSSPVTAWADQSGAGNNVVQGAGSVSLNASSIGGQKGMTFGGSASFTGSANAVTGARTLYVVAQASSTGVLGCVHDFRSSSLEHGYFYGDLGGGVLLIYGDGVNDLKAVGVSPDTNAHILTFSEDGTNTGIVFKIGSSSYTVQKLSGAAQAQTAETGAAGFSIGRRDAYGIQGFVGDICEVIVYDTVLSAPNQTSVLTYLQARYGL